MERKGFCPCAVFFLGSLTFVFVLQRLPEEQILFLLKKLQRYCEARFFRGLRVKTFVCVQINCYIIFHSKLSKIGRFNSLQTITYLLGQTYLGQIGTDFVISGFYVWGKDTNWNFWNRKTQEVHWTRYLYWFTFNYYFNSTLFLHFN